MVAFLPPYPVPRIAALKLAERRPRSGRLPFGHAALDAAIKDWPNERFTFHQGIRLIREHRPTKSGEVLWTPVRSPL